MLCRSGVERGDIGTCQDIISVRELTALTEIQCQPPFFSVIPHAYLLTAVLDFDT